MTNIVDSLRKHQRILVLGVALSVITLYMLPLDQLTHAQTKSELFEAKFQAKIDSLALKGVPQHVIDHLIDVKYHVVSILESHGL